jgi:hypothetical protein
MSEHPEHDKLWSGNSRVVLDFLNWVSANKDVRMGLRNPEDDVPLSAAEKAMGAPRIYSRGIVERSGLA